MFFGLYIAEVSCSLYTCNERNENDRKKLHKLSESHQFHETHLFIRLSLPRFVYSYRSMYTCTSSKYYYTTYVYVQYTPPSIWRILSVHPKSSNIYTERTTLYTTTRGITTTMTPAVHTGDVTRVNLLSDLIG